MMNEIRYYLTMMKNTLEQEDEKAFKPTYIVCAIKLPSGAIELQVNDTSILEKINYILDAYDDNMTLKTNSVIEIKNVMVV